MADATNMLNSELRANPISGLAILFGALVCLALMIVLTLLASGLGLSSENFNFATLLPFGFALILSFFAGGWVTARLQLLSERRF